MSSCPLCHQDFQFWPKSARRKKQCNKCSKTVCASCSTQRFLLPQVDAKKTKRVCDACAKGGLAAELDPLTLRLFTGVATVSTGRRSSQTGTTDAPPIWSPKSDNSSRPTSPVAAPSSPTTGLDDGVTASSPSSAKGSPKASAAASPTHMRRPSLQNMGEVQVPVSAMTSSPQPRRPSLISQTGLGSTAAAATATAASSSSSPISHLDQVTLPGKNTALKKDKAEPTESVAETIPSPVQRHQQQEAEKEKEEGVESVPESKSSSPSFEVPVDKPTIVVSVQPQAAPAAQQQQERYGRPAIPLNLLGDISKGVKLSPRKMEQEETEEKEQPKPQPLTQPPQQQQQQQRRPSLTTTAPVPPPAPSLVAAPTSSNIEAIPIPPAPPAMDRLGNTGAGIKLKDVEEEEKTKPAPKEEKPVSAPRGQSVAAPPVQVPSKAPEAPAIETRRSSVDNVTAAAKTQPASTSAQATAPVVMTADPDMPVLRKSPMANLLGDIQKGTLLKKVELADEPAASFSPSPSSTGGLLGDIQNGASGLMKTALPLSTEPSEGALPRCPPMGGLLADKVASLKKVESPAPAEEEEQKASRLSSPLAGGLLADLQRGAAGLKNAKAPPQEDAGSNSGGGGGGGGLKKKSKVLKPASASPPSAPVPVNPPLAADQPPPQQQPQQHRPSTTATSEAQAAPRRPSITATTAAPAPAPSVAVPQQQQPVEAAVAPVVRPPMPMKLLSEIGKGKKLKTVESKEEEEEEEKHAAKERPIAATPATKPQQPQASHIQVTRTSAASSSSRPAITVIDLSPPPHSSSASITGTALSSAQGPPRPPMPMNLLGDISKGKKLKPVDDDEVKGAPSGAGDAPSMAKAGPSPKGKPKSPSGAPPSSLKAALEAKMKVKKGSK